MNANDTDLTDAIRERVTSAFEAKTPLAIQGGGSKDFLGKRVIGAALQMQAHRGIVDYQPGELVITARSGTPLQEIETVLAEHNQMLAFEPPHFGEAATLGGSIATGLSGPRRPFAGAARDFVLGTRVVNGRGEALRFGGDVMKNVAGYDVSRLMAGAFGTLGILMDVSLKVLPRPAVEATLVSEATQGSAIRQMNEYAARPLPLSAAYWQAGRMYLRLAGAKQAVAQALNDLRGEEFEYPDFWSDVREQRTDFFENASTLWRLSLPPATPPLDIEGDTALDWGGAQRWLKSNVPAEDVRAAVAQAGGHATLFRGEDAAPFHPLSAPLLAVHKRLKKAMDPAGVLNPGKLF